MSPAELNLLLTAVRVLRAHIASPTNADAYQADNIEAIDEALAPWSPLRDDPVNESALETDEALRRELS